MSIWDHLSLVSKKTIFRKCTNFSEFCPFWNTFSDDNSQKLEWQNDSWDDEMFTSHLLLGLTKNRFMNDSLINFLWIVIWKLCPKNEKNHWNWCIFMKMPPWILHSGYFKISLKDLRRLIYQMDHIWWAPSMLKETLLLIFWEK